jgi:hypothetical protein
MITMRYLGEVNTPRVKDRLVFDGRALNVLDVKLWDEIPHEVRLTCQEVPQGG